MSCVRQPLGLGATVALALLVLVGGCNTYLDDAANRTPGEVTDDVAIHTILKTRLLRDPEVAGMRVNVEVEKGVVRLYGYVVSEAARDRAQTLAAEIRGVQRVENRLQVKP
ncbi:MAG: BON domain-containing protein [Gammaproteobacteria bacterium]|nr:BON domain-containing protein [Gammaproteobacteria bacterium]